MPDRDPEGNITPGLLAPPRVLLPEFILPLLIRIGLTIFNIIIELGLGLEFGIKHDLPRGSASLNALE